VPPWTPLSTAHFSEWHFVIRAATPSGSEHKRMTFRRAAMSLAIKVAPQQVPWYGRRISRVDQMARPLVARGPHARYSGHSSAIARATQD